MKHYIPNLIPDEHRVLPDYFKEPNQGLTDVSASPATPALEWVSYRGGPCGSCRYWPTCRL